jgi:hypothetical protein
MKSIQKYLAKKGVTNITEMHTGGGCTALFQELDNGFHMFLTDHDAAAPCCLDSPGLLCIYSPDGDEWATLLSTGTAKDCLKIMISINPKVLK